MVMSTRKHIMIMQVLFCFVCCWCGCGVDYFRLTSDLNSLFSLSVHTLPFHLDYTVYIAYTAYSLYISTRLYTHTHKTFSVWNYCCYISLFTAIGRKFHPHPLVVCDVSRDVYSSGKGGRRRGRGGGVRKLSSNHTRSSIMQPGLTVLSLPVV